ncbi:MAG: hypothetical protein HYT13_02170 [Candidatus Liptonbacteria bacterium]|nr:hypothetical protein [Candidatus Liptonbacteria bacterium]
MPKSFRRSLITSLIVIFIGFVGSAVAFYVLGIQLSSLSAKVAREKGLIAQRTGVVDILAELKKVAPEAEPYSRAMDSLLPTQDQLLGFSIYLDALAKNYGVSLGFNFQGETNAAQKDSPGSLGFALSLTGGLSNNLEFLKALEAKSARFLFVVQNFSLNRKSGGDYNMSVQGLVFFK